MKHRHRVCKNVHRRAHGGGGWSGDGRGWGVGVLSALFYQLPCWVSSLENLSLELFEPDCLFLLCQTPCVLAEGKTYRPPLEDNEENFCLHFPLLDFLSPPLHGGFSFPYLLALSFSLNPVLQLHLVLFRTDLGLWAREVLAKEGRRGLCNWPALGVWQRAGPKPLTLPQLNKSLGYYVKTHDCLILLF